MTKNRNKAGAAPLHAAVRHIAYHVPQAVLCNRRLAEAFPRWTPEKIEEKTGIAERRVAGAEECASDLAVVAAEKLFGSGACRPGEVDYLLLCTQSPDYFLPPTACVLQDRLGLPTSAGALDFNLGCSGFVYGLGIAKGLVETGQASTVLLLTAETYSKHIHPEDGSVRALFGDAAAATLIQGLPHETAGGEAAIGPFVYGTDGSGAGHLIVEAGGMRRRHGGTEVIEDAHGNRRTERHLSMDGPEIFNFTLRVVHDTVRRLLERSGKRAEEIDHFVFHQANGYMLEHLRRKLGIPEAKFVVALREIGNTVSATIPIALCAAQDEGRLTSGDTVMVVGFGVGYSWGAALLRWFGRGLP